MVRRSVVVGYPGVEMKMLHLSAHSSSLAHIDMIELLAVRVIEIRVPFHGWNPNHLIQIVESGLRGEHLQRPYECKLVEITRGDNLSSGILLENGRGKGLPHISNVIDNSGANHPPQ